MVLVWLLSWVLIAWGSLWLMLELWIWRIRSAIRHKVTGAPVPATPFLQILYVLVQNLLGINTGGFLDLFEKARKELGPTFITWRGWTPVLLACELEDAKHLLSEKGDFYKCELPKDNPVINSLFSKSLVGTTGEEWKAQRKAFDPSFKYKKLKTLVPIFVKATEKLMSDWDKECDKGLIKVEEGITNLTLEVIGLAGFSFSFGALEKNEDGSSKAASAIENYDTILSSLFDPVGLLVPSLSKYIRPEYTKRLAKAHEEMDALLYNLIDAHRQDSKDKNTEEEGDLLDHILALSPSGQLSNKEIKDNIFLFFVAGHDTSSSVLTSALYFLSQRPDIQERAYEEVMSTIGNSEMTFNHIKQMDLVSNIIKEACRLRPAILATTARRCARDGVVLGDYILPEGTFTSPSMAGVNYNEKIWENPTQFDPDRYKDKPTLESAILTFSYGPHVCIGKKFALIEMTIALSMMIRKFSFRLKPGYEWKFKSFALTLKPHDGLPLIVTRREQTAQM